MTALVRQSATHVGPVFVHAGRVKVPIIYAKDQVFEIGKAIELVEGTDVTLMSHGLMAADAIKAAEELEAEGISARRRSRRTRKRRVIHFT